MRIKRIVLENKSHASVFGRKLGNVVVSEEDLSRCGLLKSAYHIKRGAFSAAGRSEKTDKLAVRYLKGKIVYRNDHLV